MTDPLAFTYVLVTEDRINELRAGFSRFIFANIPTDAIHPFPPAGALVCAAAPLTPQTAQQTTGTITGQVVDSASRQPLSDVSLVVEGTSIGVTTRVDGSFTIAGVPSGQQVVRARRIGYGSQSATVTVPAGGTVSVTFALIRQAAILEQMVDRWREA